MQTRRRFAGLGLAAAASGWLSPVWAESFPDKPVRIILPYPPGTGPDTIIRHVSEKWSKWWGQPVIIDNRPGGNSWIALEAAKRSRPDGYTLVMADNAHVSIQPHIYRQLPFDPVKDFEPVTPMYWSKMFLVVPANSAWNNFNDLAAAARSKPGGLTYGSWGVGTHAHLGGSMLENVLGVKMTHVPYKETPMVFASVSSGELDFAFGTGSTVGPLYRAKKVKFLALAQKQRDTRFPEVPTIQEAGGPADFLLNAWQAMYAPRGLPKHVVERVNADMQRAIMEPDLRETLAVGGFSPWLGAPAELARFQESDLKAFGEVIRKMKISVD